ncbi:MAG TPA: YEATS-associated helix-containing protein [Longimicrobium sp.]|jgi:hypothetical protein
MLDPLIWILMVIVSAGLFGGAINYHLSSSDDTPKPSLARSLTVGTGAAFMVPLFLNMISSNLLDLIRGGSNVAADPSKLFVFAGFCLVAAISSKAFINTLSDRILREARETREEVREAKAELARVQTVLEPIVAKETESDAIPVEDQLVRLQTSVPNDSPEDRVLRALVPGRWTLRSASGIAKESEVSQAEAIRLLDGLVDRGLVGHRTGKNGPRWFMTENGRTELGIS